MHHSRPRLSRVALVLTAGIALLVGALAPAANAGVTAKDEGTIKVCKEVDGKSDKKFGFVIRQKDEGKVDDFTLRDGKCHKTDVEKGTYRVREKDIPKGCELKNIEVVRGDWERINKKNAVAVVKVKKDKTTEILFTNKCKKKDDHDNNSRAA